MIKLTFPGYSQGDISISGSSTSGGSIIVNPMARQTNAAGSRIYKYNVL